MVLKMLNQVLLNQLVFTWIILASAKCYYFLCSVGDWAQGLLNVRRLLYH